ncbi:hypothetical protein M5X18_07730, partial [Paenibacillus anseongense]
FEPLVLVSVSLSVAELSVSEALLAPLLLVDVSVAVELLSVSDVLCAPLKLVVVSLTDVVPSVLEELVAPPVVTEFAFWGESKADALASFFGARE